MQVSNDDLLVALVLVIAGQLEAEAKAAGRTRVGGDYSREAAALIRKKKADVLLLLQE